MGAPYLILSPPPYLVLDPLIRRIETGNGCRVEELALIDEQDREYLDRERRRREADALVDEKRRLHAYQRDHTTRRIARKIAVEPRRKRHPAVIGPAGELVLRFIEIEAHHAIP